METIKLTEEQINDLKEIGNIGSGNAASRLSDIIHRRCGLEIPEVVYLKQNGIVAKFNIKQAFAVAIFIKIMGEVPAAMLVVMKRTHAHNILRYMTSIAKQAAGKDLTFTAQFALKQLGEILTRSFSESIMQFLEAKAKFTVPEIIIDTWSTALEVILSKISHPEEELLLIHSTFFDDERTFEGKFLYVLSQESQKIILNRIKLLLGE